MFLGMLMLNRVQDDCEDGMLTLKQVQGDVVQGDNSGGLKCGSTWRNKFAYAQRGVHP